MRNPGVIVDFVTMLERFEKRQLCGRGMQALHWSWLKEHPGAYLFLRDAALWQHTSAGTEHAVDLTWLVRSIRRNSGGWWVTRW